ncbi:MAG: hypothetical protein Q7J42_07380 [Sulfuritalea sp.]|nr:hypothetical protein [Sulfuritalea sp.]
MAKFLNTSATNYFLEEMIKDAKDRLILISPFLKLNDRMKELLADRLTSSKLAQKLGMKAHEFVEKLVASGHLEVREGKHYLTSKGKEVGGEFRMSPKFGPYFLWPESLKP